MTNVHVTQQGTVGGQAATTSGDGGDSRNATATRDEEDNGKVTATPAALALIAELTAEYGPIMFHQSGGCCDGSSPMCYPQGEFLLADHDVLLGEIGGAPFYIGGAQYEVWKHTDLIIDVVPGRGGMFSLDNGREKRFLTRSSVCAVPPAQ